MTAGLWSERGLWEATAAPAPATGEASALDGERVALCVIGAGFTGCSAALEAATAGARVAVLEAERVGWGGSGRNVGLVNAGLWTPPAEVERLLGAAAGQRLNATLAAGPDLVFRLIAEHAIACDAVRAGTLHLAPDAKGVADLEARAAQGRARGAPLRLLQGAETAERTGFQGFRAALHDARAGVVQPLSYGRGLAAAAAARGALIAERAPVRSIAREGAGWRVAFRGGALLADALLVATNAYARDLAGAPRQAYAPVGYFQVATEPLPQDMRAAILPGGEGAWDTATVMSSMRLDAAGRLLIGGVGGLAAASRGLHAAWAARKLRALAPALPRLTLAHAWSGRIAMTADHLPKIIAFGDRALAVFGYSGRGIAPGTVFGRAAARRLLGLEDGSAADALPLTPVVAHVERLTGLRGASVEAGAALAHAADSRFSRRSSYEGV